MVFRNAAEKRIMIPGVADLVFGVIVTIVPVKRWFQIGFAALLYWLNIGWLHIIQTDGTVCQGDSTDTIELLKKRREDYE